VEAPVVWQFPCDPRSRLKRYEDLRIGYKYEITDFLRAHSAPLPDYFDEQCRMATEKRCVWQSEWNYYQGNKYGLTEMHKKDYYFVIFSLKCPETVTREQLPDMDVAWVELPADKSKNATAVSLEEQAIEASAELNLPAPKPALWALHTNAGLRYTLVNGYTWFSTEPSVYTHRSKEVHAGDTWVEVVAVPVALGWTANGESVAWCSGPGDELSSSNIDWLKSAGRYRPFYTDAPSGCSKKFERTSPGFPDQQVSGTMQIRWQISWVGSGNSSGTLPDMYSTVTTEPLAITEAQTLVTR
jgi:hypothetical protein